MSKLVNTWGLLVLIAGLAAGCSQASSEPSSQASATGAADAAETSDNAYLLTERPADAQGVAAGARAKQAKRKSPSKD